jgi:iron complex transport system substrate-binding protein
LIKNLIKILSFFALSPAVIACETAIDASRITVAGGSITEILFMLEMEKNIVAVDTTSNYPAIAEDMPSIGYVRNVSAEGVLSLTPTVIIGEHDMGPPETLAQLKNSGIEHFVVEEVHTSEGIIDKFLCVARIIGRETMAREIVQEKLLVEINLLSKLIEKRAIPPPRVLFVLSMRSGSPIVGGQGVSADGFISMFGGVNSVKFEGWKPVGPEAIISADPDMIVITQRGLTNYGTLKEFKNHPYLRLTKAAKNNNILTMDGMEMLGFGPRTIDAAVAVAKQLVD